MAVLNFCVVCQATENLLRCGRCKSVQYCGPKHQKQDWKNHKNYCKELLGIYNDHQELKDLPLCIAPYLASEKPFDTLRVKDWKEAMDHLRVKLPGQAFKKYVTEELSWPLTLLAAICKFNLDGKNKLRVHIMGATDRYMNHGYVTDLLEVFPLPETEIFLVGPEVGESDIAMQYSNTTGNTVCVTPIVACYHDYTKRSGFSLPDLVVAFHPGIQAKSYDWKPTLRFLVSKKIPTVFTCWNERELEDHCGILGSEDIKADIRTKGAAPFPSSLKRHLSASTGRNETIIMVMNSYWITFKGGSCASDEQLDQRLREALDETLNLSPSELAEISASDDDLPEHVGMAILEVKMQLKFIRMVREGEKEYRQEEGKKKAKELFSGCVWLWDKHKEGGATLPPMLKRVTSRAYNNLAIMALEENDVEGAVKMGEKAVLIDPTYHDAQMHLSHFYAKKSELASAVCKEALEQHPEDSVYWKMEESEPVRGKAVEAQVAMKKAELCRDRAKELPKDKDESGKSEMHMRYQKLIDVETYLKKLNLF